MSPPDVSIVIVSYNAKEYLRACLRSIPASNEPPVRYEVVVVDNASQDGAADMVAREFPETRLIRNPENVGFARACNQGASASSGRYVLLLNPDTELLRGCLATLVTFADAHPDAGVVGCAHLSPGGDLVTSIGYGYISPRVAKVTRVQRLDRGWVSGACMLLRHTACDAVGWLNESFFFGCDDVEICWRMNKAGWHVYCTPDAKVIHHGAASTRTNPAVLLQNQRNRRAMVRMHAPRWLYLAWLPIALLETYVRA